MRYIKLLSGIVPATDAILAYVNAEDVNMHAVVRDLMRFRGVEANEGDSLYLALLDHLYMYADKSSAVERADGLDCMTIPYLGHGDVIILDNPSQSFVDNLKRDSFRRMVDIAISEQA